MEVETSGKPVNSVLERVLCMNILSSDYFKELYRLKTYHEVIDEIYNQVDHVEPWMTGNCRGPSTAFCLLYKFFTMKLTVKQMQGLLNHRDSPYIRAIGFLYLRYVGDPKSLWGWFEKYITDDEEFSPSSSGRVTTMGLYVRELLLDQHYFDTLFPRIPVPVMKQIVSNLERLKISTQSSGVTGTGSRHATEDTARRPPSVKAALSVSFGQRAPHRASTRDSSPVRRNVSAARDHRAHGDDHRFLKHENNRHIKDDEEDRNRNRERERSRDRVGDRERDRPLEAGRARERDWEENRDRGKQKNRSRERDCDHARVRQRDRECESSRNWKRGRECDDSEHLSCGTCNRCRAGGSERYRIGEKDRGRNKVDVGATRSLSPEKFQGGVRHSFPDRGRSSVLPSIARLLDVYGTGTERGHEAQGRLADVKEKSCEDVIRLGDTSWR